MITTHTTWTDQPIRLFHSPRTGFCVWRMVLVSIFVLGGWFVKEASAQVSIPVYGNWCGPNHGFKKPPIDAVDGVCRLHDICARRMRYGDPLEKIQHCDCDRIIVQRMPGAIANTRTTHGKRMGRLIFGYFSLAICHCKRQVCIPTPSCRKEKKCTKKFGKKICVPVPICKKVNKCNTMKVYGSGGRCLGRMKP